MTRLEQLLDLRARVDVEIALERSRLAPPRRKKRAVAECGTDSGYYRHNRTIGEPACDPCKAAHTKAVNERTLRKLRAAAEVAA